MTVSQKTQQRIDRSDVTRTIVAYIEHCFAPSSPRLIPREYRLEDLCTIRQVLDLLNSRLVTASLRGGQVALAGPKAAVIELSPCISEHKALLLWWLSLPRLLPAPLDADFSAAGGLPVVYPYMEQEGDSFLFSSLTHDEWNHRLEQMVLVYCSDVDEELPRREAQDASPEEEAAAFLLEDYGAYIDYRGGCHHCGCRALPVDGGNIAG